MGGRGKREILPSPHMPYQSFVLQKTPKCCGTSSLHLGQGPKEYSKFHFKNYHLNQLSGELDDRQLKVRAHVVNLSWVSPLQHSEEGLSGVRDIQEMPGLEACALNRAVGGM